MSEEGGIAAAIMRAHADYGSFMDKRTGFETTYKRIEKVFEETQGDLMSIRSEWLQQQIELSNLSFQQMVLGDPQQPNTQQRPTNLPANSNRANRRGLSPAELETNAILNAKTAIDIESAMRSEQIRQLSVTQQAVFRRRMEATRDFEMLRKEFSTWQQKWPSQFDPYWRHTDPECIRTVQENEEALEAMKARSPLNVPALIAQGLLETRLGRPGDAIKTLDAAIRMDTNLNPIAYSARALTHSDKQKSKLDLTKAIGSAPKNPYVKWLRAKLAASQGDFSTAKNELSGLLALQDHEIAARRFIAVLIAIRPGKSAKDPADALQHAKLASDLTGKENWYSELVLSMALNVSGKTEEARTKAEHAKELSKDESAGLCTKVIEWIETKGPINWEFIH